MTPQRINRDRAAGVLLASACGDALGAPYEFKPPLPDDSIVAMTGGGAFGWAPGEWTDDTSMAIPIAHAAAEGLDLRDEAVQDRIVAAWVYWSRTAPDVGIQTRAVLAGIEPTAWAARASAERVHRLNGRSGGNGSLMRTAPVALAYLDDPVALAEAARAISDLTHFEADAGDACVLWCLAIRHAVLSGELDVRFGIEALPSDRRDVWLARIDDAETRLPTQFTRNGWVVEAFQAAWSAIVHTESTDATHLRGALEAAVRGGHDTDTVAAIAGGLLGARWGASAVPSAWSRIVHGWPDLRADDLVRFGVLAAHGGNAGSDGWPLAERFDYSGWGDVSTLVRHPHDDGVWLGAVGALDALPDDVDAVVSLCRLGSAQIPGRIQHRVGLWLIDSPDAAANPNLEFVLAEAADAVAALRAEGRTVLLHCVQAQSRTPTIAALYAARYRGVAPDTALREVCAALPNAGPNAAFRAAVTRLA